MTSTDPHTLKARLAVLSASMRAEHRVAQWCALDRQYKVLRARMERVDAEIANRRAT